MSLALWRPSLRAPITDVLAWTECFALMAAVIAKKLPDKAPQLVAYLRKIVHAARNFQGSVWVASNPGFPFRILSCSFGEKSEVKPGQISHVIRWHRDVNVPFAKATRDVESLLCIAKGLRERCESQNQAEGDKVTCCVDSLFIKRSYSSRLDI